MSEKVYLKAIWDIYGREDLKEVYRFNKNNFSIQFAKKIQREIFQATNTIVFQEQWQSDLKPQHNRRRIIVRHWKIVYEILDAKTVIILRVFDTRQDPSKYTKK